MHSAGEVFKDILANRSANLARIVMILHLEEGFVALKEGPGLNLLFGKVSAAGRHRHVFFDNKLC